MGYDVSNDIIYVNVNDLPKNSKEIINLDDPIDNQKVRD